MFKSNAILPSLLILASQLTRPAISQTSNPNGCLRLSGSTACPGFSSAWVHPANLSNAFPFFSEVDSVASFDAGVFRYLSDPDQYRQTKFVEQLGCSNSSLTMLRYARTMLCSSWVNSRWSIECFDLYDNSTTATGTKMICQDSCIAMSKDEQRIVSNEQYCPGPDLTGGARDRNITKDFVQCTNWSTLATNNTDTCVAGDTNEGNCGYGPSTDQLCAFCNSSAPENCCYSGNTDLTSCSYSLADLPPQANNQPGTQGDPESAGKGGLSGGQIAGIVVGSVVGGLLLLGLLAWMLMFCGVLPICGYGRRRHQDARSNKRSSTGAEAQPTLDRTNAGLLDNSGGTSPDGSMMTPAMSQLGRSGTGAMSSRTMFGGGSVLSAGDKAGIAAAGAAAPTALGRPLATGAAPQRALLSSVRDENQSGEHLILPNSTVTVLWPYAAALPDELSLQPGMKLVVLRIYDDAWGTGQIVSGAQGDAGKQGAFPLVCVTENNTASEYSASVGMGGTESVSGRSRI